MSAVTRIRTWVIAATTQCTNHYTITAVIPAYVIQVAEFKNGFRVKNKINKQAKKKNQTITTMKATKNKNKRNIQKNKMITSKASGKDKLIKDDEGTDESVSDNLRVRSFGRIRIRISDL